MNNLAKTSGLTIPRGAPRLEDNAQWQNRFEIKSASSNRVYIIAQNKDSGLWGCSCPGYLSNRRCKHLVDGCGLPESKIHGRNQFAAKKAAEKFG